MAAHTHSSVGMPGTRKGRGRELIHVGRRRSVPSNFGIATSYLAIAIGLGWATDHLIDFYVDDPAHVLRWQSAGDLLFYLATSALIYLLISWYTKKVSTIREELAADRRLRSLGEVAATIAHEFNNMLMGAKLSAELASRSIPPGTNAANALAEVKASLGRGTMLASRILRFTRPGAAVRERVDLAGWLQSTIAEARAQILRLNIDVHVPAGEIAIDMDPALMHHAMLNLLINARDAGASTADVTAQITGKRVTVIVADNGPGLPASVRDTLFQPLVTTKANGTGLGLSLVYFVVRAHDGEIEVLSDPTIGTTFVITLPLPQKKHVKVPAPISNTPQHFAHADSAAERPFS